MPADLGRLLARYVLLAVGVVLLNFFIPRLLPGSPFAFSAGDGSNQAMPLSATAKAQLRTYYGLDAPLSRQIASFLQHLARGDFGRSISRSASVSQLMLDRLPWTLGLLTFSMALSTLIGGVVGVVAGWHPHGRWDRTIVSAASALAAIPEFLLAIGLLLIFAAGLGWLPLFGGETVFARHGGGATGTWRHALDIGRHLTLPAATLVLAGTAPFLLLARDATASLQRDPYLMVARAKGLRERDVVREHALPNIVFPLLNCLGLRFGSLLGGALVVERVFGVPGLGGLAYDAIRARDYPVLQALFLLSSLGVLAANFLVELIQLSALRRRGLGGG